MEGYLKFAVLRILAKKPLSGYNLMKHIEGVTGKKPSPGSMYPLLKSLKEKDLLEEKEIGRSKIYALTSKGKKAVREIAQHHQKMLESMEKNIRMMHSVIGKQDTFPLEILRRIQQGQAPFASLTGDLIKLRDTLFEASQKELTQRQRKELSAIISSTIRKVKAVCNQS